MSEDIRRKLFPEWDIVLDTGSVILAWRGRNEWYPKLIIFIQEYFRLLVNRFDFIASEQSKEEYLWD